MNRFFFIFYFFCVYNFFGFSGLFSEEKKVQQNIYLLTLKNDPKFKKFSSYAGYINKQIYSHDRAIKLALNDSKIKIRNLKIKINYKNIQITSLNDAIEKVRKNITIGSAIILDLPIEMVIKLTEEFRKKDIVFINSRNKDMQIRNENCQSNLFHTIPSYRMYSDSIAQFLVIKNWKKVLILHGKSSVDQTMLKNFVASSKKFNIDILEIKDFSLSKNFKDRDKNNASLLTQGIKFDLIVLFDQVGEFGRYLQYNLSEPKAVIGNSGLVPRAWHWTWERYGAPQLNKRFNQIKIRKENKNDSSLRNMSDEDWASWVAIKLLIESVKDNDLNGSINFNKLFKNKELAVDIYKGKVGTLRKWNNQLRQPMLLTSHNATFLKVPNEKFLHPKFAEDTLGLDEIESNCIFN